jgi:hypothetical protein
MVSLFVDVIKLLMAAPAKHNVPALLHLPMAPVKINSAIKLIFTSETNKIYGCSAG